MNQGPNEIYRSQTQNIPSLLSNIFRKRDNERWDRKWKGEWMMVPLIFVKLNAKSLIFLEFWACYLDFSSSLMGAVKRKRFGEIGIWDFGETPRDEVPVTHDGVVWYVLSFSCYVMSDSFAKPWTVALQDPLFMAIPRQEYWVDCHFFSRGSSWPRDQTHVSCVGRWILPLSQQGSLNDGLLEKYSSRSVKNILEQRQGKLTTWIRIF